MTETFECEHCHRTFTKVWTDEQALDDATKVFGEIEESERAIVCEDCYERIMAWAREEGLL